MTVVVDQSATAPRAAHRYQTFFEVRGGADVVGRVREQIGSWLRERNWDPPLEETGHHVDPDGRELVVLHRRDTDTRDVRFRTREPSPLGTWTTTVTVHAAAQGGSWIGLQVANDEGRYVRVPRLARYLVQVLEVHDGDVWMSDEPRVVHPSGVDRLADEVCGLDRQGLYLVAGTADDGTPLREHVRRVTAWTRETAGLAQVAVLDPVATVAFAEAMGARHGTPSGTIRTYLPDVDPAVDADGARHRILGAARLADEPVDVVRLMLGRIARRHAAERPRPARFTPVDQAFSRMEDRLLLDALDEPTADAVLPTPQPSPERIGTVAEQPDFAHSLAQIALVKRTLGIAELTPAVLDPIARSLARARAGEGATARLAREMDDRRRQIEDLREKVEFFQALDNDHELELALAQEQLHRTADENRALRARLRAVDVGPAVLVTEAGAATDYPSDFTELAGWVSERCPAGVVFTGNLRQVRDLHDHDPLGRIAKTAWEGLLVLADYVRARESGDHGGGVRTYLKQTPSGYRTMPPKKFAGKETAATMQGWGEQRAFPVPEEVHPAGEVHMEAHFKLGQVGMVSPRMYYHDDWSRTGRVYVGYIGAHLRNTHTN